MIFDTGSANLWVPNKKPFLTKHSLYDHTKSSTYKANGSTFSILYGSGPVSGYYSRDTFSVDTMQVPDYLFAEVNSTKGLGIAYYLAKFDGILGLGWGAISVDHVATPLEGLITAGALTTESFAFYLGNQSAGELTFGGTDPKHYTVRKKTKKSARPGGACCCVSVAYVVCSVCCVAHESTNV